MNKRKPATSIPELVAELRLASYFLPSEGDWVTHGEMIMPKNVCSDAAVLIEEMGAQIEQFERASGFNPGRRRRLE